MNKEDHQCFVIDVCVPLDENVKANEKIKRDRYMPLLVGLKRLYPEYSFSIVPIVIGATGLVTNSLLSHLKGMIPNMQLKALLGSMRIMKTATTIKN